MTVAMRSNFSQCLTILLIALFGVAAVGCSKTPAQRMAQAQQYESNAAYRKAMIELKNVLKKAPDNAKARFLLGKVQLQRGQPSDAVNQLTRAQQLGVKTEEVQPLLAQALLFVHKYDQLLKDIQVDAGQQPSLQAELLAARGHAQLGLGHRDKAAAAFHKAIHIYPRIAQALIGQAQLALIDKDTETAGKKLDHALEADPEAARAWLVKGNIAAYQKRFPQAIDDLQKAIDAPRDKVSPAEKFSARGRLAAILIKQGKYEKAKTRVESMLTQAPQHPVPNYLRALIAYHDKDYGLAVKKLQTVLSKAPANGRAQELLGSIKAKQGDTAQARMYLSQALSNDPTNPRKVALLARVLMDQGDTDQAVQVLNDAVRRGVKDQRILAMLNNAIVATGRTAAGRDYLQQNLLPNTHNPDVQMSLAKALMQAGQADQANALLRQIKTADKGGDFKRNALLVRSLLHQGKKKQALSQARALVRAHPKAAAAYNLLGSVLVIVDRADDARSQFEKARHLAPDNTAATLNLGLLALRSGKFRQAVKELQPLTRKGHGNSRASMLLARAYAGLGETDKAVRTLHDAVDSQPGALQPRLVLIRYYLAHKRFGKAQKLAQDALAQAPDNAGLMNLVGLTQLAGGDNKHAQASFAQAADKAPEMPAFKVNLGRAQIGAEQLPAAIKTLQSLRKQQPDYRPAISLLAFAQMKNQQPKEALATADELRQQAGQNGAGEMLTGMLQEMHKDYGAAAKAFAQAVKAGRRGALERQVVARQKAHLTPAEQPLVDWVSKHENDAQAKANLAQWYADHHEYAKAAARYKELLAGSHGQDAGLLNNLAWAYYKQGDRRALATAKKAYRLAPHSAAVADTLGWIQVHQDELPPGVKHLQQAADKNPESPEIAYHLSYALAKSGDKTKALARLNRVLDDKSDFSNRAAAEKLEKRLKGQTGS